VNTYRKTYPGADYVAQSRVIRSGAGPISRYSVQIMRSRSRYAGADKRGWTLFVSIASMRFEIGTR
jgi:hypothetical protein